MNRKRTFSVILIAALLVASVCVASMPIGISAAQADKESILTTYVSEDKDQAFIAPNGVDVSVMVWNYEEKLRERAEYNELLGKAKTREERDALSKKIDGDRDAAVSDISLASFIDLKSETCPDWYAGSYIMRNREYGLDNPYETDGTQEPFKYCLMVVEGMEEEAYEYLGDLSEYGDTLVIRTVSFGSYADGIAIYDELAETLYRLENLEVSSIAYSTQYGAISVGIPTEEFNEETYAYFRELANETGRVIILERSGRIVLE